jgi:hypothetical protein
VGIIFIGAAIYVGTTIDNVTPQVNRGITVCNSTLGRLGSLIFHDRAEQCEQVTQQIPTFLAYGNIANRAFGIIGGFCTVIGMIGLVNAARTNKVHV